MTTPVSSTIWDYLPNFPANLNAEKLGINLILEPLTQEQVAKLQKDDSEVINETIEEGSQDTERLRSKITSHAAGI
jgi:hypothetical protein